MMWEAVEGAAGTECMDVPGGTLYRTAWRVNMGTGQPALDGSAMVFVPDVAPHVMKSVSVEVSPAPAATPVELVATAPAAEPAADEEPAS